MTEDNKQENKQPGRNRHRKSPLIVRLLQFAFSRMGPVFPKLMARLAYRLWFSTTRFSRPEREQEWLKGADKGRITSEHGEVVTYRWGKGPVVLLLHGWNGRGTQLGGFVAPLLEQGYQVVSFDGIGHGESDGKDTSIFKLSAATHAVVNQHGPVEGIIAHSFGAAVTAYSLNNGLAVQKVVAISAPASIRFLAEHFSRAMHIPPKVQAEFEKMLEKEFGEHIWDEISPEANMARIEGVEALIIHDKHDKDVPVEHSKRLHAAWKGSRLHNTQGLGHQRILRDEDTIRKAVEFFQGAAD